MKKPNILFITSDQQHYNTIGAFNSQISTPHLDRLVKSGTTFSNAYTVNPTCTPTRCSLITGKYPSQHGAWTLGTKLREDELTIGEVLQKEGYETALIGKAHFQQLRGSKKYPSLEAYPILQDLPFWEKFEDYFYGFKHVELARNHTCEAHVGQHYALWLEEKGCTNWRDYFVKPTGNLEKDSIKHKWEIKEEYHYDTWIAERTNALLEQYKEEEKSFFLWASFFDPHPPYLVPEPWDTLYKDKTITLQGLAEGEHEKNPPYFKKTQEIEPDFSEFEESGMCIHGLQSHLIDEDLLKKDTETYYSMISLMDKYIGKILDKLDELGLTENTIIVFTTDHGHFLGQHGLNAKGPFMYDDLIKVPLIASWKNHIPSNKVNTSLQSLVDIPTTFFGLLGLEKPHEMTGLNEAEVWLGLKDKLRDHIICEHRHEATTVHMKTYVDERYKLTVYYNKTYGQLFDLKEDPKELNNLWEEEDYKEIKQALFLKYIWAEMGKESMWMPRIWHA